MLLAVDIVPLEIRQTMTGFSTHMTTYSISFFVFLFCFVVFLEENIPRVHNRIRRF